MIGSLLHTLSLCANCPRRTNKIHYKKLRRRKLPWYKRNIHRKYFRRKARQREEANSWNGIPGVDDPLPLYFIVPFLHKIGNNIAEEFDYMSTLNPAILDLIGPTPLTLTSANSLVSRTHPFCFFGEDNQLISLTELTAELNDHELLLPRYQQIFISTKDKICVIDTGASVSVTNDKTLFTDLDTSPSALSNTISGINGHPTLVKGIGTMRLTLMADDGTKRILDVPNTFYVPSATVTLFAIVKYNIAKRDANQHLSKCHLSVEDDVSLQFGKDIGGGTLTFDVEATGYLPVAKVAKLQSPLKAHSTFPLLHPNNLNLSSAQKELLFLHNKLGHINLQWVQHLIRQNIFSSTPATTTKEAICLCPACQLAKQARRPTGTTKTKIRPEKDGGLKRDSLRVGAVISSDQFVSSTPGRLPNTYGKESVKEKYIGGTVFIDEASELIYVRNQVSLGATETINAKHSFERDAMRSGIPILGYRADNGVYRSKAWSADISAQKQSMQFCAVGAHHQNAIAERCIRTLSTCARAMLLHALIYWPEEVSLEYWPFAIDYAAYLYNRLPRMKTNLSPEEVFYSVKSSHDDLRSAHTLFCPAYVLDPTIQDGKKIPRWNPRSKLGQFVGRSHSHAANVGLIRNRLTGKVSPQFHVVYDDNFTTVTSDISHDNQPTPTSFNQLIQFPSMTTENMEDPADVDALLRHREHRPRPTPTRVQQMPPILPSSSSEPATIPQLLREFSPTEGAESTPPVTPASQHENTSEEPILQDVSPSQDPLPMQDPSNHDDVSEASEGDEDTEETPPSTRYPSRQRRSPDRYIPGAYSLDSKPACPIGVILQHYSEILGYHDSFLIFDFETNTKSDSLTKAYDLFDLYKCDDFDNNLIDSIHPFAFSARTNAEDTPNFRQAMASEDREGFIKAMEVEMEQLRSMDAYEIVPRDEAIKAGVHILDSTWAFKRKRYPDGTVKKLKARLCVRGDQQIEGVDFFDTFSPVVAWSTIRLLFVLSIALNLVTVQTDYQLAFVHAPVTKPTYMECPRNYEVPGKVYRLKRNLYGMRDAPLNFFLYLKKGLMQRGFKPSKLDPCLFINEKEHVLVLTYVDDCIYFARNMDTIQNSIKSLRKPVKGSTGDDATKFLVNIESDYAGFLGIDITKQDDGTITLTQTGLIDRIIAALGLDPDSVKPKNEPAIAEPLAKNEDGPPRREIWSYPSVIGMLLYLTSNSRPECSFSVNQAARFSHNPRLIHERAVKRIGRYLKGTRDKGLIMKPDSNMHLEMFADADFAGLWNVEDREESICVRSRTGYVITLGNVPVTWSSKLQTETATSTMHAEYIALSTAMRELLPLNRLYDELCSVLDIERKENARIVRVYEDNEGALKLANAPLPKVTPQSKHFAVKLHWFKEQVQNENFRILPVRTDLQKADLMTKGLVGKPFVEKRRLLMNW